METRQDTSELFAKLKGIAVEYNENLSRLMVKAVEAYEAATERCALLKEISKSSEIVKNFPDQMEPAGENHSTQVKNLLKEGTHVQPGFKAAIEGIVDKFNSAESTADVMKEFGLDEDFLCGKEGVLPETFGTTRDLELRHSRLVIPGEPPEILASSRYGPPKSYGRAIDKPITNLNDLNRVTVQFQNPHAYALFYYALCKEFKVYARNKHDQPGGYTQVPCVHLMIDWEGGYLVEVMLMLTAFLEIKKMQHHAYDILRIKHVMDLVEGFGVENENAKLKHALAEKDAEIAALKVYEDKRVMVDVDKGAEIAALKAALERERVGKVSYSCGFGW